MTMKDALKIARETAQVPPCTLKAHYGRNKRTDRAIRILHTDAAGASIAGRQIAEAVGGAYRYSAGFAAVWL